jgi:hypothetical protein
MALLCVNIALPPVISLLSFLPLRTFFLKLPPIGSTPQPINTSLGIRFPSNDTDPRIKALLLRLYSPFHLSDSNSTVLNMESSTEPAGQKRAANSPASDIPRQKKICSAKMEGLGFLE